MARVDPQTLRRELHDAGLPDDFSVVAVPQVVAAETIRELDAFVALFDRVTTRPSWQRAAVVDAPEWAREPRREVCCFSAWDFHLPGDGSWQLIELNDNGSGFLFASIIDGVYHRLAADPGLEPPAPHDVVAFLEREERELFGAPQGGRCFILDDAESLARGHFRVEHELLAAQLRAHGRDVAIGTAAELAIGETSLVVNRSTDFYWKGDAFEPLRRAFAARTVYVAPNPFTYATRSDKRLLELLSLPERDAELGITPDERAVLAAHVPETHVLRDANLEELARRKHELFWKPAHGYASRGVIPSDAIGHARLGRLLRAGEPYVAQRFVPKGQLEVDGARLATDLRVWAYRGTRYRLSGRATRPRGGLVGWLPTFVRLDRTRGSVG